MNRRPSFDPGNPACWPRYCCAILRNDHGLYLLERRAAGDPDVAGQLVCFGGGREPDEHPDECIRRELREELGWEAGELEFCVRLLHPGQPAAPDEREVAWFYRGRAPAGVSFRTEPGVAAVWLASEDLHNHPVGGWNLAAIQAELRGDAIAWTTG